MTKVKEPETRTETCAECEQLRAAFLAAEEDEEIAATGTAFHAHRATHRRGA